jgi:fructose-1,6-bisphosphatase/inositol monophosphatase family enzyme
VLSEESGATEFEWPLSGNELLVIVDPLDGSTNASKGIPWFATALCAVDRDGLRVALVAEQSGSETRFSAIRGAGALCDGSRIHSALPVSMKDAVVGVNGMPQQPGGWWQFRVFGAAALDLCLVASGGLDGYVDCDSHGVWDYAASLLVCREAGCVIGEVHGRELIVPDARERRSPVVASSAGLLAELTTLASR